MARTCARASISWLAKSSLRPARLSSVEGQTEYSFWHALTRDVAYGQIPRSARAAKHEAAADWLEQMAGDRVADHADLLAHHTTEALALASAAGQATDAELELRAARYLVLAGDRALELDVGRGRCALPPSAGDTACRLGAPRPHAPEAG